VICLSGISHLAAAVNFARYILYLGDSAVATIQLIVEHMCWIPSMLPTTSKGMLNLAVVDEANQIKSTLKIRSQHV
jgi:hypothetical protein